MAEKQANFGTGFDRGLVATMLPYPLSQADGFMQLPANRDKPLENEWYFAGPILMAAGFVVLGFLLAYRATGRWLAQHPWTIAAVLALWLGLGSPGLLWTLFGRLPIIRAVNHHPHRLLPFFTFFALIVGGQLIERLLRRWPSRKWEMAIAAITAVVMLWHVSLARNSLWCYGDRPYPSLPQPVAAAVLPNENPQCGRYMWVGPWRSGQPGYAQLMPHSLASAYGALAVDGYDPIIAGRPESLANKLILMKTRWRLHEPTVFAGYSWPMPTTIGRTAAIGRPFGKRIGASATWTRRPQPMRKNLFPQRNFGPTAATCGFMKCWPASSLAFDRGTARSGATSPLWRQRRSDRLIREQAAIGCRQHGNATVGKGCRRR